MKIENSDLRERALAAMDALPMDKAELSRRSGVPYHTLDKFLKGATCRTSAENAQAIRVALGLTDEGDADYLELRQLYSELPEDTRRFVLATVRGLVGRKP